MIIKGKKRRRQFLMTTSKLSCIWLNLVLQFSEAWNDWKYFFSPAWTRCQFIVGLQPSCVSPIPIYTPGWFRGAEYSKVFRLKINFYCRVFFTSVCNVTLVNKMEAYRRDLSYPSNFYKRVSKKKLSEIWISRIGGRGTVLLELLPVLFILLQVVT